MSNENTIMLTDSEQDLYNLLSDTQKKLFPLLRLNNKVNNREILEKLQDVTEEVREIRRIQKKRDDFAGDLFGTFRRVLAYCNTEFHKLFYNKEQ